MHRHSIRNRAGSARQAWAWWVALIVVLAGASWSASAQDAAPPASDVAPRVETVADGLEHPWSLAFLPDGRQLVTERAGRLRIVDATGRLSSPIAGVPDVFAVSQGGLFDVVAHPDFSMNGWVYLSLAHGSEARNATRLVRARLKGGHLIDMEMLFTARPWKATPVHYGGRIAFLPDGTLLLSVGDGFDHRESAQRLDNHFGKTIRLNDDGSVPADNPFVDEAGALPEIYTLGHRNPQGLAVDDASGAIWLHDHGPAGGDELNRLVAGGNYGWPIATHGRDYSGAAISPFERYDGTIDPVTHWTPSIAPSGLAVLPAVGECDLLVGALKARELRCLALEDQAVTAERVLVDGVGRIRDVRVDASGTVWLLSDSEAGRLMRLTMR